MNSKPVVHYFCTNKIEVEDISRILYRNFLFSVYILVFLLRARKKNLVGLMKYLVKLPEFFVQADKTCD